MGDQQTTGYGPSGATGRYSRLFFDGDANKFELWKQKFLGYLKIKKLKNVISEAKPADPAQDAWAEKNEEVYAELIQLLDDTSLTLVMRDAEDDGRKAFEILQNHYMGASKPRIIALYMELTTLSKTRDESLTNYMLRAETAAAALKTNKETVSDSLLMAMVMKGLPDEYKSFIVVMNQIEETELTFQDFKKQLRSFEETEKARSGSNGEDSVMKNRAFYKSRGEQEKRPFNAKCYSCGKVGHKSSDCRDKQENKLWCNTCRSSSHNDEACRGRRRDANKSLADSYHTDRPEEHTFAFMIGDENHDKTTNNILVDCGATSHIITDKSLFKSFDESFRPENHMIELADGTRETGVAQKRGEAVIHLKDSTGRVIPVVLKNSLFVPTYPLHIFSVRAATDAGAAVIFSQEKNYLQACDGTEFNIVTKGRLYYFETNYAKDSVKVTRDLMSWHTILGHCNIDDVEKLEGLVSGMKISDSKVRSQCEICVLGKQVKTKCTEPRCRSSKPLEMVHTDLAGPIQPIAKEGFRFAIVFVDDYSGAIFVYFLKQKCDAVKACEKFFADCAPYGQVKCMRSDNGTEFTCKEFEELLVKNGVKHEFSAPYSPHQNGVAERSWRTLFEMARCLILKSELPKSLWTYAVMISAYIRNRCYSRRIQQTPYFLLTGKKPDVGKMQEFGTVCYAYENVAKSKLDARSKQGVFVGYDRNSPAYLVYHADVKSVKKYRCVVFAKSPHTNQGAIETNDDCDEFETVGNGDENDGEDDSDDVNPESVPHGQNVQVEENVVEAQNAEVVNGEQKVPENVRKNPDRDRRYPPRYNDYIMDDKVNLSVDYICKAVFGVPNTYEEAMQGPEADKWKQAIEEEMNSLIENDTFEETSLPENREKVGGRWVFAVKDGPDGAKRYKARYVAKGYNQTEGIDYQETFSPTAKMISLRALMQLCVQYDLKVHQLDVKTAYLNAPIDCELYIEPPKGFRNADCVWKLKKSLYGLKQSGRNWNKVLHEYLVNLGFEPSEADSCVYSKFDKCIVFLLVWVDDMIIAGSDETVLLEIKSELQTKFKLSDLGVLSYFLGVEFKVDDECVKMSQEHYLTKMLCKFRMENCKPRSTVCEAKLNFPTDEYEIVDEVKYREMVGSLIYAMTCTRPDLCWIVTKLSQYLSKPGVEHHTAAKHVLRYIKGTINLELCFRKVEKFELLGFSDADWAGDSDRRSVTGYCFSLGENTGMVSWKSKRQATVALSSCEAEYMALAAATQEGLFLLQLMSDLDRNVKFECFTLYGDNQGSLALAKNPVNHQRSKHIDIKYHFLRSEVSCGRMNLVYVPTHANVADVFTKGLSKVKMESFVQRLFGF